MGRVVLFALRVSGRHVDHTVIVGVLRLLWGLFRDLLQAAGPSGCSGRFSGLCGLWRGLLGRHEQLVVCCQCAVQVGAQWQAFCQSANGCLAGHLIPPGHPRSRVFCAADVANLLHLLVRQNLNISGPVLHLGHRINTNNISAFTKPIRRMLRHQIDAWPILEAVVLVNDLGIN